MIKFNIKKSKRILTGAAAALTLFAFGCGSNAKATEPARAEAQVSAALSAPSESPVPSARQSAGGSGYGESDIFSERDFDSSYDTDAAVKITLNGSSAQSSSNSVEINGANITVKEEGTYVVSGALSDGSVIIDAGDSEKIHLVLDGADITSSKSAPIYVKQADKVFITLADGSSNALSNGGSFADSGEDNIDAVIFSKDDVTINGGGSLYVSSPAGHGIVSKDSLRITSGNIEITSASHALDGNDEVSVINADLTLTAGKDGIHSENEEDSSLGFIAIESGNFIIDAQGDAIDSSSAVRINGGAFNIITGGGYENAEVKSSRGFGGFPGGEMQRGGYGSRNAAENPAYQTENADSDSTSMKGVKASKTLIINGGEFTLNTADDAFHSNGSAAVTGGGFKIETGDDAFHADETVSISDGDINIIQSYEGIEGQTIDISGGNIAIFASDDGLNAAGGIDLSGTGGRDGMFGPRGGGSGGSIAIAGGVLDITAYGDGIDSNGTLEVTGGTITVAGPTQGDTSALDTDAGSYISGGTFIGTGAANGMAQTFTGADQGLISVNAGNNPAGTKIELKDGAGNTVVSYTPDLDFALVILSSPEIISGGTYTLTVGSQSGEFTAK